MYKSIFFAVAWLVGATGAGAQAYPDKPIRVICTYAAGGGGDIIVRYFANQLEKLTGQRMLVENRAGANGHIGVEAALAAKPDGYTVMINSASTVVGNTLLMNAARYDPLNDVQPVASLFHLGLALAVRANSDIRNVADLTALLKKKNGDASYGVATASALVASAMYFAMSGANGFRVNYKASAEAARDVSQGQLEFAFVDATLGLQQVRAGQVRLIAVTPRGGASAAPDVPAMSAAGYPEYDYDVKWLGWFPKGTPRPIMDQMHKLMTVVAQMPETKKFLFTSGADPLISTSSENAAAMVRADFGMWRRIVEIAKIEKE